MYLKKVFKFDAAHNLQCYHGKCEALHGHTYRLVVTVRGEPDQEGMVMDFAELKSMVKEKVIDRLDHSYVNDIIPQPTAENISKWAWEQLQVPLGSKGVRLEQIEIWETETSGVVITGDDMS
ncbi:MAG: 6-carboxytetrahydropterin synthase QueD [Synergistales bacterium]|nr:6-carboxytetrahydropterin synthase QueD [Synergistales bacterium]